MTFQAIPFALRLERFLAGAGCLVLLQLAEVATAEVSVAQTKQVSSMLPVHLDRPNRMVYIGSRPDKRVTSDGIDHVLVSRTGDLVGEPLFIVRQLQRWDEKGSRSGSFALSPGLPLPLSGSRLTSGFGIRRHPLLGGWRSHSGVDLSARLGSPVVATADGTVTQANWHGGYGLLVAIDRGDGVQIRYAHLSRLNVKAGQTVRTGDVVGYVGSTGRSTGPHLHYEVRVNGTPIDPSVSLR